MPIAVAAVERDLRHAVEDFSHRSHRCATMRFLRDSTVGNLAHSRFALLDKSRLRKPGR